VEYAVVALVACLASCLTFFTGFGLGTLLLPAFAVFFPVPEAVALTACVHFLNGLFKLALVGRRAAWPVVLRFGAPAVVAAFGGAAVLRWLGNLEPIARYHLGGRTFAIEPVKVAIAVLMVGFAIVELSRRIKDASVSVRWLPVGGLVSGFFGGLSETSVATLPSRPYRVATLPRLARRPQRVRNPDATSGLARVIRGG
jgi:hypothetical protein